MKPFDARGYLQVQGLRVFHAHLHLHWTALGLAAFLLMTRVRRPAEALAAVCCYFGVILLHEVGHAAMARRLGYRAPVIRLSFLHGVCEVDGPESRRDEIFIAWGGVLAQLAVAVPLIALEQFPAVMAQPLVAIVIGGFGNASLLLAVLNLLPIAGLDGAKTWRIVPLLWRDRRDRGTAKKAAQELLRRLR
jgi:Zn-dependent protease